MSTVLNCPHTYAQEEEGVLTIGFTDNVDQPSQYLLLQRSLTPSDQDKRLGHDRVHIELTDQGYSAYGGIWRVRLASDRLSLFLDEKMAQTLNCEAELEVTLKLDAQEAADLRKHLSRIFAGQSVTVE